MPLPLFDLLSRTNIEVKHHAIEFEIRGKVIRVLQAVEVCLHRTVQRLITEYLDKAGHKNDLSGALFRPVKNNASKTLEKHLNPASVYVEVVHYYGKKVGITTDVHGFCVHA